MAAGSFGVSIDTSSMLAMMGVVCLVVMGGPATVCEISVVPVNKQDRELVAKQPQHDSSHPNQNRQLAYVPEGRVCGFTATPIVGSTDGVDDVLTRLAGLGDCGAGSSIHIPMQSINNNEGGTTLTELPIFSANGRLP